jgi:sphingomyelin phosphodiesterase
MSDPNG